MTFVVAVHGTRGDVEPCAAVALELLRRGHHVRVAVPPNLVRFVESAGLAPALDYGVDSQKQLDADIFRDFWKLQNPITALRRGREYITAGWAEMSETLASLAIGADLILTGTTYQEVAANVAERQGVPFAALHYFPFRVNSHMVPVPLPRSVLRRGWSVVEWVHWRILKKPEDAQRSALGLPPAKVRSVRRIVEGGALEIQAYDELFFPGLSAEWEGARPLVGSISLELPTAKDDELTEWIAAVYSELERIGPPLLAIHGNADDAELRERLPKQRTVDAEGISIAMVHNGGPAAGRLERMRKRFPDADAVVFGHSHMPLHEEQDGFQIFNPGSPTERRRAPTHTMGLARVEDGAVEFELLVLG